MRLSQMSGRRQMALAKQRQHLRGSNIGHAETRSCAGAANSSASSRIAAAPGTSPRASLRRARNTAYETKVSTLSHLPRQLEALLPVLLAASRSFHS